MIYVTLYVEFTLDFNAFLSLIALCLEIIVNMDMDRDPIMAIGTDTKVLY